MTWKDLPPLRVTMKKNGVLVFDKKTKEFLKDEQFLNWSLMYETEKPTLIGIHLSKRVRLHSHVFRWENPHMDIRIPDPMFTAAGVSILDVENCIFELQAEPYSKGIFFIDLKKPLPVEG